MKSAYELAMERLEKEQGASRTLTGGQKAAIAEVESRMKAKLAETEILFGQKITSAVAAGNGEEVRRLQEEKARDVARARERAEEEKEAIRKG